MKKILFVIFIVVCSCYLYSYDKTIEGELSDLAFANIESLAQSEGTVNRICFDYGSIDCDGFKAKYVVTGYR